MIVNLGGQCIHKGRFYKNGQTVPIDDQPCLSCTCRRSILQCFLRVCPPVISLEAQKRVHDNVPQSSEKCRLVKEPNQCCPVVKCDYSEEERLNKALIYSASEPVLDSSNRNYPSSAVNISAQDLIKPTSIIIQPTTMDPSSEDLGSSKIEPDLTLTERTKDSLFLINSNPNSHDDHIDGLLRNSTRNAMSNALLDALVEAAYSSAAQASGINMQGSCMVNGSLYIEGSAVLTGTNNYCQYCYCIRQKIMCVRPKCQLYISGCNPRYSSEFACCPMSYDCGSSNHTSVRPRPHGSQEVVEKLSAALESISKLSQLEKAAHADLMGRHAGDRSLNTNSSLTILPNAIMEALMRSANPTSASFMNAPTNTSNATLTTTSTSTTSTTTTTTTTTSTTTTTPEPKSNDKDDGESKNNEKAKEDDEKSKEDEKAKDDDENDNDDEDKNGENDSNDKDNNKKRNNEMGSGDGFMEPMNRLGPMPTNSGSSECVENGRHYEIGEQIPTLDRCKHCYCSLDGVKECKIVECALKIAHNCKPVIPKDHCCPIRYDCPSMLNKNTSDGSLHNIVGSRYRSEKDSNQNFLVPTLDFSSQLSPLSSQCKTDLAGECVNSTYSVGQGSPILDSLIPSSPIENQNMNHVAQNPVELNPISLNEMLKNFTGSENHTSMLSGDINSNPVSNANASLLNDELNKFIMQINQNSDVTSSSPLALTNNHSFVSNGQRQANGHEQALQLNGPIVETVRQHNQQPRMADYHSVQADPNLVNLQPSTENVGIVGIPSIEPEPIGNLLRRDHMSLVNVGSYSNVQDRPIESSTANPSNGRLLESSVEYLNNSSDSTSSNSRRPSSDDPRSRRFSGLPNGVSGNSNLLASDLNGFDQPANRYSLYNSGDQPEPVNTSDDYFDTANDSNTRYDGSNNRSTGARSVTLHFMGNDVYNNNNFSNSNNNNSILDNLTSDQPAPYTTSTLNPISSNWNVTPNAYTNAVVFDDELSTPAGPQLSQGRTVDVNLLHSELPLTTSSPIQSTTGTPFGLEADRSNETRGWLRSLSGFVNQFGRRLNVARSDNRNELLSAASGSPSQPTDGISSNSTDQPSILNKLLRNVVGINGNSMVTGRSNQENANSGLVMRPLQSLISVINNWSRPEQDSDTMISSSESNNVEIVTALAPMDSSLWTEPTQDIEERNRNYNSFARRSDIIDSSSSLNSMQNVESRSTLKSNPSDLITRKIVPDTSLIARVQPKSQLVCFDSITNRTYQANELIPKDDPCKTCTCVLGKELCQTLVCPEKPADNCRKERPKRGECCPNYLCGDNVSSHQLSDFEQPRSPQISGHDNQMIGQISATPNQIQLSTNQPLQASGQHKPLIAHNNPAFESRGILSGRDRLPSQPIRASDLWNSLPSHLRFKPNGLSPSMPVSNVHRIQENPNTNDHFLMMIQNQIDPRLIMKNMNSSPLNQNYNHLNQQVSFPLRSNTLGSIQFPTAPNPSRLPFNTNRPNQIIKPSHNSQSDPIRPPIDIEHSMAPRVPPSRPQEQNRVAFQHNNQIPLKPPQIKDPPNLEPISWLPVNKPSLGPIEKPSINRTSSQTTTTTNPSSIIDSVDEMKGHGSASTESSMIAGQSQPSVTTPLNESISPNYEKGTSSTKNITQDSQPTSSVSALTSQNIDSTTTVRSSTHKTNLNDDMSMNPVDDLPTPTTKLSTVSVPALENTNTKTGPEISYSSTEQDVLNSTSESPRNVKSEEDTSEISNFEDPFRVSECNVYGRLYKLGETIASLSDGCKLCICSSSGVECQMKC